MNRKDAIDELVEDLELRGLLLRVTCRKFARDVEILNRMQKRFAGKDLSPYIRRALRARFRAMSDAQIAEQEVLESQEYYLRAKG